MISQRGMIWGSRDKSRETVFEGHVTGISDHMTYHVTIM